MCIYIICMHGYTVKIYVFERERRNMSGGRGEGDSQADSVPSLEPDAGLDLMTLRP